VVLLFLEKIRFRTIPGKLQFGVMRQTRKGDTNHLNQAFHKERIHEFFAGITRPVLLVLNILGLVSN